MIAIESWQTALGKGEEVKYPYQAVLLLYGDKFSDVSQKLENATTVSALDQVVVDIEQLAKEFPPSFPNISELRFQTANKYLKFSDMLLKKRQSVSARNAMKKANELLQLVESGDFGG